MEIKFQEVMQTMEVNCYGKTDIDEMIRICIAEAYNEKHKNRDAKKSEKSQRQENMDGRKVLKECTRINNIISS